MANKTFNTRIKHKRDTSANWTSADPVLLNGELIIVDTASGEMRFKIGDGIKRYSQLPFQDEMLRNSFADTYATSAALQKMLPKVTTITLGSTWIGSTSPYYQDVSLSCCTETSIVDLQPTPDQLTAWQDEGWAFTTLSGNGTVRVYVTGGKPNTSISLQVRVQEVTVI